MRTIRIVIIEDDEVIRESFVFLIEKNSAHKFIAGFSNCEQALKSGVLIEADVILLDIGLPGINGVEAISLLKRAAPQSHILMLTISENEELVFRALKNGASGYLVKNTPVKKIVGALEDVMAGGGPMSDSIARMVISSFQRAPITPLSKRETEILEKIALGKSRRQIA
ncbi:MAG: response regulator transcription factor, partial [Proteobacteria bacterium]